MSIIPYLGCTIVALHGGQNDLAFGLLHTSHEQVIKSIPNILSQFLQAVHVAAAKALMALLGI